MRDAPGRGPRRAADRRGAAGLRHRGRGPAPRARSTRASCALRASRTRPRGLPLDPRLRGVCGRARERVWVVTPRTGTAARSSSRGSGPAGARHPARATTTSRVSSTSTTSTSTETHPGLPAPRGGGRGGGARSSRRSPERRTVDGDGAPARTRLPGERRLRGPHPRGARVGRRGVDLVGVVTAPPRPAGRGAARLRPTPVAVRGRGRSACRS